MYQRKTTTKQRSTYQPPQFNTESSKDIAVGAGIRTNNKTILKVARVVPSENYFACYLPMGHRNEYRGKEVWYDLSTGKAHGMIDVTEWDVLSVFPVDSFNPAGKYNDY